MSKPFSLTKKFMLALVLVTNPLPNIYNYMYFY